MNWNNVLVWQDKGCINERIGDVFKIDNMHVNVASKFSSLPRKDSHVNTCRNCRVASCLLP